MTLVQMGTERTEYRIYKTPTGWALCKSRCWESRKLGGLHTVSWRRYYKDRDKAEASLERILGDVILDGQWTNEWGTWVRMKPE